MHLGEAGDKKTLKVIDLHTGNIYKEIPIDIGRRHFKVTHLEDTSLYREGDRVVLDGEVTESVEKEMKERGILLEVRRKAVTIPSEVRLKDNPSDPVTYWRDYCKIQGVCDKFIDFSMNAIFKKPEIIALLDHNKILREPISLVFEKMCIENFGPFRGSHTIDFVTGVTLVTGHYINKQGTDSNGVGKSLYTAGAFLWGCTGKTDPRFGASTSKMVVSHGEDTSSVSIYGTVNGIAFDICRKMPHTLDFHMADRASGNNTIKMTQTRINRTLFGMDGDLFTFLTRTLVWTQKNVLRFLDATDTASKQEIAKLVDIDLWEAIYELCRTELKSVEDTLKEQCCTSKV